MSMAEAISHRGPDSNGQWEDPSNCFSIAHQRLSVVDLSSEGSQPMSSESGRFIIAFNGEVYNHMEIRSELNQQWRGHSDTETLLASIERFGLENSLKKCAGMFSFALWDRKERKLHLCRDRFGEKPLYWGWVYQFKRKILAFASDAAAIKSLPGLHPLSLCHDSLKRYIQNGYLPASSSIYKELRQVKPGQIKTFSDPQTVEESRLWWDTTIEAEKCFARQERNRHLSKDDYLEIVKAQLTETIKDQSQADVPLGSFLSGGIDSSLITSILQSTTGRANTFTVSFPDETDFDESKYAKEIAGFLNTNHTEMILTAKDALNLVPELGNMYTEPFADSSQIATHLVCRSAKENGLTVALSGDGGDELFGGYNRHRLAPQIYKRTKNIPLPIKLLASTALKALPTKNTGLLRNKQKKLSEALMHSGSLEECYSSITSGWDPLNILSDELALEIKRNSTRILSLPDAPSLEEKIMLADTISYLPSDILTKVDRASMYTSFEVRAPFLDHRIAMLAWSLPLRMKIRGGCGKWVLRQILKDYLPSDLFQRPKAGFALPLGQWLRGPLKEWASDLLDINLIRTQGFLNASVVEKTWSSHLRGVDLTEQVWAIIMWQDWCSRNF